MTTFEERVLAYTALALVCSFASVFAGFAAGALVFIPTAAVMEALFWLGLLKPARSRAPGRAPVNNH